MVSLSSTEHQVGWPEAQNILRIMHEGPLTVRPTPGQRCVEWPQTDARAKLWVRRTNTNLTRDRHRPCGLQTNLGPSACSNMQLQHEMAMSQDHWKLKGLLSSLLLDLLHCHPMYLRGKRSVGKPAQLGSTATCQDLQSPPISSHSLFWLDLCSCCFATLTPIRSMHSRPDKRAFTLNNMFSRYLGSFHEKFDQNRSELLLQSA